MRKIVFVFALRFLFACKQEPPREIEKIIYVKDTVIVNHYIVKG